MKCPVCGEDFKGLPVKCSLCGVELRKRIWIPIALMALAGVGLGLAVSAALEALGAFCR